MSAAGEELTAFLQRQGKKFERIIYVGDGSNDFCPVLRLRRLIEFVPPSFLAFMITFSRTSQDMVLCRTSKGLERRIAREGQAHGLKCQVKYWEGAWQVEEFFNELASS